MPSEMFELYKNIQLFISYGNSNFTNKHYFAEIFDVKKKLHISVYFNLNLNHGVIEKLSI